MSPSYGAPATCASVIPYPASVVGVVVKSVNATLCKALSASAPCANVAESVIPYPASVVGVPLTTAHGIVPFTPSTSNVLSSANTLPVRLPSNETEGTIVTLLPPVMDIVFPSIESVCASVFTSLAYTSSKLSLILSNAERILSPSPVNSPVPKLIVCFAIYYALNDLILYC